MLQVKWTRWHRTQEPDPEHWCAVKGMPGPSSSTSRLPCGSESPMRVSERRFGATAWINTH
ncbi:hypothetical protein I540_0895 [Mycobacteroides abscessus subsp. bolletii 1513]|uniref:Uncharacterized protein n=1 Tax=Mycobacteroides abscessus subsp. bolletii 1513 TaxID=1299321 RepID=X8DTI4_9MYCO|nr:hypothetical protein I540_0895 [Mycobacteroides abscessus subsp. bolletii 1513]